ncbi:hypothetical protein GCM10007160_07590 [Litchfieldella qijiaojingensis]|uniref:DUF190 domain-containing protein n=1 Tax=Litchfieldella qijiaojingensis TaxID=980347 RepID=A0ABQ2YG89_9GAMM|nr:DUF190 domain-containing protein [Halomonas qijiaojingensis]GGX82649.1 hypothetical protein GCM10007160_07590 [Halomonas qijiaojingensis]
MKTLQAGYEVIFMAPQSRRHKGKRAIEAVAECARDLGIRRMTRRVDVEGTGENGYLHSAHFFELDDQPVELMYVLDDDLAERLIDTVDQEGIPVFCLRRRVEYGHLGS